MFLSFPSAGRRQPAESKPIGNSGIYRRRHRCLSHHRETMTTPGKPSAHTTENTAEPVEQTLKQNSDLAHAEPLAVPQLVDPDAFLCRQVGIGFHIECNAFSSVVDLNTSNHRQALHFYLEPGDVEKLVEYAVHQALCGCLFILVENILPGKRSSLTPSTTQRRNLTHENSNSAIIYVFQPNLSPVLTFYNQNKVHWATFPTLVSSWARTSYGSETILMDLPQFACQVWLHECEVATAFE